MKNVLLVSVLALSLSSTAVLARPLIGTAAPVHAPAPIQTSGPGGSTALPVKANTGASAPAPAPISTTFQNGGAILAPAITGASGQGPISTTFQGAGSGPMLPAIH